MHVPASKRIKQVLIFCDIHTLILQVLHICLFTCATLQDGCKHMTSGFFPLAGLCLCEKGIMAKTLLC